MKTLLLILFTISVNISFGQCNGFHSTQCELPQNWWYEFDSQSMSNGIFPGQAFRIKAILYEGYDYFIGFCKQEDCENFHYKLSFEESELDENFANTENENLQFFELSIEKTTVVVIEVKLNKTQNISYTATDLKCVGIIIGNKKTDE